MEIVGVFARFAPIGGEIEYPAFIVDPDDVFAVEGAAGDLIDQPSGAVVKVKMSPSILFAPLDQFSAAIHEAKTTQLDIGIQSFPDEGRGHRIVCTRHADIDP